MKSACQTCGMLLDDPGEFHPYAFCLWKMAGHDPWAELRWIADKLGLGEVRVVNVRDLPAQPARGAAK